ncbi:MAG: hypothetical protein JWP63_6977 [Candidatus Solibacter sp.]|jgi:hypothetical protein|nr:hypothetical protein [Candidatus Solibacter sp.]
MDWLEEELKQALARTEPDPGFESRVRRRQVKTMPRWIGIAATLVVGIAAAEGYRWHQGQVAKEQVMMAMRIAGDRLNRVQTQLVRGTRQ